MPSTIDEAIGKSLAAFCLCSSLIELLVAKKVISENEREIVSNAAISALSDVPEVTQSEREFALAMLLPLKNSGSRH
jgi:hypothetical protein